MALDFGLIVGLLFLIVGFSVVGMIVYVGLKHFPLRRRNVEDEPPE